MILIKEFEVISRTDKEMFREATNIIRKLRKDFIIVSLHFTKFNNLTCKLTIEVTQNES